MARVRTPYRRYTEDEKAEIVRLRDANVSFAEIARRLSRSPEALREWHRAYSSLVVADRQLKRPAPPPPADANNSFIQPPSLARLMSGR